MTPLQKIQALVPELSQDERRKLGVLVATFSGGSSPGKAAKPPTRASDWLLDGLIWELRRRGLSAGRPPDPGKLSSSYEEQGTLIREHFELSLKPTGKPSPTELSVLGRVLARALVEHISQKTPITLRSLLNNVSKMPEAVERSYPGYLATGMLYFLLLGRKSNGQN